MPEPRETGRRDRMWAGFAACLLLQAPIHVHLGANIASAAGPEAVAMPYACRVERGEVRMQRGIERSYRIVGEREQQSLRLCSPVAGGNCRSIEVHRFSFDCGGARVAWIEAADASASSHPWRTTVEGGRMTLHFRPDGPIRDRQPPLALPAGFAPAPATGLRFMPAPPSALPGTRQGASSKPPGAAVLSKAVAVVGDAAELPRPTLVGVARATEDAAPPPVEAWTERGEPIASSTSLPVMGQGWSATVTHGGDEALTHWDLLARGGGSSAWLAALGLAALLLSATAIATRQRPGARKPSAGPTLNTSTGASAQAPAAATVEPPRSAAALCETPPPPPPRRARPSARADAPPRLVANEAKPPPLPSEPPSDWDAVVELRTTADALLGIVRQIIADHVPDGALRKVLIADLATIADRLDGPELATALDEGRLDLVHPVYAQAILDLERVRTLARIEHQRALEVAEPRRLPETFDEACEFLGVNPRASHAVVKKVVDALRQNWHPDLAGDESDRIEREERIKRINAAWDLIRAR